MSGGDEEPDDAGDEPADRPEPRHDDPADEANEPDERPDEPDTPDGDTQDGDSDSGEDRVRPDSPHSDPHTDDENTDEPDADGSDTDDADLNGTDGDGADGDDTDGDSADGDDTDGDSADGDDSDGDSADGDDSDGDDAGGASMPDWEEKQWGPLEEAVDDAGDDEVADERPYDPAFDDTVTDDTVATAELDATDDGGTDRESSSDGDADPSGNIEAVDRGDDAGDETGEGGTEAVPIERFDPDSVGLTTEADDDFSTTGESKPVGADSSGADAGDAAAEEGAASDGGTLPVGEGNTIGGAADEYDDGGGGGGFGGFRDGPEYDQEMPLADHIEEMMTRLLTVIVVMAVVSAPAFLFADAVINYVWDSILGAAGSQAKPHVYRPLSLVLARLKTATLAGFIVALPVFVYETYLFMRPGLYPKERRYYLAAVPTSLVLASVGVLFAFFLVLPAIFVYFVTYSEGAAEIAFGLTDTYGLMLTMMGFFALIFQIPLFIMLAIMMGLTSRKWLADRRILFWGAFAGLSAMFAFDPTGMAPIIVALTMIVLFEGTLFLLLWVERGKEFVGRRGSDA